MSANGRNPAQGGGAFGDEMPTAAEERELAALGQSIRRAYVTAPTADTTEGHLAAMLAEAARIDAGSAPAATPAGPAVLSPRRRRSLALRVAAGALAGVLAMAGLAVAGVRPPEPISDLFEGLGVEMPGSDDRGGAADGDKAEPAAEPSGDEEIPSQGGQEQARPSGPGAENGRGEDEGRGQGAEHGTGNGQGGSQQGGQGQGGGHGQGPEASAEGQETAEDAQSGQTPPPEPGNSENHSQSGANPSPPGGPPANPGPPAGAGSNNGGPPASAGPPASTGPPAGTGPPTDTRGSSSTDTRGSSSTDAGVLVTPPGGGKPPK